MLSVHGEESDYRKKKIRRGRSCLSNEYDAAMELMSEFSKFQKDASTGMGYASANSTHIS